MLKTNKHTQITIKLCLGIKIKNKILNSFFFAIMLPSIFFANIANAGLIDRGNGLIYDNVLNVTWLQNTNLSGSALTWTSAVSWVNNLVYGGFSNWRLPIILGTDGLNCRFYSSYSYQGTDCGYNVRTAIIDPSTGLATTVYSELAYMYHINLGNVALFDTSGNYSGGYNLSNTSFTDAITGNTVSFTHVPRSLYFSGTLNSQNPKLAWTFSSRGGLQRPIIINSQSYYYGAWAVRNGDVGTVNTTTSVPEPNTLAIFSLALFISGLFSLITCGRYK